MVLVCYRARDDRARLLFSTVLGRGLDLRRAGSDVKISPCLAGSLPVMWGKLPKRLPRIHTSIKFLLQSGWKRGILLDGIHYYKEKRVLPSHMLKKPNISLAPKLSADTKYNFFIDLVAACICSLFNVVNNQFYIPMAIDAGANNFQVGILAAAPAIGLIFSPLWASWIERSDPKPFTVLPNLIGRALLLLPAFFGSPLVFVMTIIVFHLLMGIQAPAYAALMTRVYPVRYRGRLMGNVRVLMGLLMIPLAYLVGRWSEAEGSAGPLAAASITGILSILLFSLLRESEPVPEKPVATRRASLKEQWKLVKNNRELGIFLIAATFSGFANVVAQPLYQIIQMEVLELNFVQIGWARTTYFACLLGSYFVIGLLIDKYSPRIVIGAGIAAFAIVPMLYGFSESYPAVLIASGIQGIGDAIWDIGIMNYLFSLAPGREAVVFGLHLLLFGIRGTIGPLLSSSLAGEVPYSVMMIAASLCGWIGTGVFVHAGRKRKLTAATDSDIKAKM